MSGPTLSELQALFWSAIAEHPGAGEAATELLRLVPPTKHLAPAEQLRIYADMYLWRLVDVLREDFPRVARRLGDAPFLEAARAYLARHPSRHPSIRHVGRAFPAFLAAALELELPPFSSDLARLEWARIEVSDAPDTRPLTLADLERIPPEGWAELRFRPIPALEVLCVDWPVHRIWAGNGASVPLRERTVLRVWRQEFAVHHAVADPIEDAALGVLVRGGSFAEICARCGDEREAAALLVRWLEDGILGAALLPDGRRIPAEG